MKGKVEMPAKDSPPAHTHNAHVRAHTFVLDFRRGHSLGRISTSNKAPQICNATIRREKCKRVAFHFFQEIARIYTFPMETIEKFHLCRGKYVLCHIISCNTLHVLHNDYTFRPKKNIKITRKTMFCTLLKQEIKNQQ